MEPHSPELVASLQRERKLRRSAESEAVQNHLMEQVLQAQLADVQAAIDMGQYSELIAEMDEHAVREASELIAEMDDLAVREACVEAGIETRDECRMRQLLVKYLCNSPAGELTQHAHAVKFVAADEDDDGDESVSTGDDITTEDSIEDLQNDNEQVVLQQKLREALDFRHEIECLTPPDSDGEAQEQINALDEIDAEILTLEEKLGFGSDGGGSVLSTDSSGCENTADRQPVKLCNTHKVPEEMREGSSAQALLAAAGLELSPGGSSYRIIGRKPRTPSPQQTSVRRYRYCSS